MPWPLLSRIQAWNLATTAVRALAAVALQKLIAEQYGPPGVLVLGQFVLLQSLCYGLLTDGLNRAILVEAGAAPTPAASRAVLARGGMVALGLLAGVTVLAWALMAYVLPDAAPIAFPLALALGSAGWYWWVAAGLQYQEKPVEVFALAALQGLLVLTAAYLPPDWMPAFPSQAVTGDLPARLLLLAVAQALLALGVGGIYQFRLRAGAAERHASGLIPKIWAYGGLSLAVLLAGRGADVLVRAYAMRVGDWAELGLWQAAVRLGDVWMVPLTPLFATVFFAQAVRMGPRQLGQALQDQLRLAALAALGIAVASVAAPGLLGLFNRADFAQASTYYYAQLPGDLLRLLTLPISIALMASGKLRTLAWLEGLSLVTYLAATALFGSWLGVLGLAVAHSVRYLLFAGATVYAARSFFAKAASSFTDSPS